MARSQNTTKRQFVAKNVNDHCGRVGLQEVGSTTLTWFTKTRSLLRDKMNPKARFLAKPPHCNAIVKWVEACIHSDVSWRRGPGTTQHREGVHFRRGHVQVGETPFSKQDTQEKGCLDTQ